MDLFSGGLFFLGGGGGGGGRGLLSEFYGSLFGPYWGNIGIAFFCMYARTGRRVSQQQREKNKTNKLKTYLKSSDFFLQLSVGVL